MAEIVLVEACSHSPFLYLEPRNWNEIRNARPRNPRNPETSEEENAALHARCMAAFDALREKMEAAKPDVILIFGDDQQELFGLDNFPAFGVFVGEEFGGYRTLARLRQAAALRRIGDHGVALSVYDRLAADDGVDGHLRDLARLLGAQAQLELGAADDEVAARLDPLLTGGNPWRHSARELRGALALRQGDLDTARREFASLTDDAGAPPGIRARAAEVLAAVKQGR